MAQVLIFVKIFRSRVLLKDTRTYFHTIITQSMLSKLMINCLKKKRKVKMIQELHPSEKLGQIITLVTMTTQEQLIGLEPNYWMP